MFAYCLNNPVYYIDDGGNMADDPAGQIGQDLGIWLYELITGKEHPSRQTKQLEQEITQEQYELIINAAKWVYDKYNSDEIKEEKAAIKIYSGVQDVGESVGIMLLPDFTISNELFAFRKFSFGLLKVLWGGAELLIEVFDS